MTLSKKRQLQATISHRNFDQPALVNHVCDDVSTGRNLENVGVCAMGGRVDTLPKVQSATTRLRGPSFCVMASRTFASESLSADER
jgi:hypothetical protein